MWHIYRNRFTTTAMIALLLSAAGWAQERSRSAEELKAGIANEERMLEQRTAKTERVRAAVRKSAGEIAEIERQLGLERNPEERRRFQARLESLRPRLLRRTILQRRAELKQQELAEHIELLQEERARGVSLTPQQSRQKRRDFLTRRLDRAEALMQTIREFERSAVSERERARISRLAGEQKALIAEIKRALTKLAG